MVNSYARIAGIILVLGNALYLYDQTVCRGSEPNIPEGRVLVIGIDGVRPDALEIADTPAIDALISAGAFTNNTKILGDRYRKNETISGPGWSSFLTGVWADKHGVNDNTFRGENYDEYPHFFVHLKRAFPKAVTGSFVDWEPIDTFILRDADVREVCPASSRDSLSLKDEKLANKAAKFLAEQNPHAVFVYFGQVDEIGSPRWVSSKCAKLSAGSTGCRCPCCEPYESNSITSGVPCRELACCYFHGSRRSR